MAAGRRIRILATGAAVSAVTLVAAWAALHSATPTVANLWVDANGGSCVRQSTPGAYVDANACTHDGAYQAAHSGDSVVVKKADYGTIKFHERSVALTSPVTFHITDGTTYGTINIGCENQSNGCLPVALEHVDWLTMTGTKGAWSADFLYFALATHITVDGIVVDRRFQEGKSVFWAGSTDHTTIRNAKICCNLNSPLMESFIATDDYTANANITIEDSDIGSMRRNSLAVHNECFLAGGVPGLTLTRTRWHGCNVMNINIGAFGSAGAIDQTGFVFTNNVFESPTNQTEFDKLYFPWFQGCNNVDYDRATGWVFTNNLFESLWYDCGGFQGLTLRGNVGTFGNSGCPVGVTYSHNVWNTACDATDTAVPDIMTNPGAYFGGISTHEWWLKAGSPPVDAADPGSYPATDILGVSRPQGSAPDAGPNERVP